MWGQRDSHYDRWAVFLECWGRGEPADPGTLPPLVAEDFAVDAWQRLNDRLLNAIEARTTAWAKALMTAMSQARDEFEASRAMAQARHGLTAIRAFTTHPSLPADLRGMLLGVVDQMIRSSQQSLEEQIERQGRSGADRRAADARLRTLRDNSLAAVVADPPAPTAALADGWSADMSAAKRRHIIVD
jgi:hypothetical protein